tara:strand:- start:887 stop:1594 length:708 start_codon:yes stop_codon:yes gene_type:complete
MVPKILRNFLISKFKPRKWEVYFSNSILKNFFSELFSLNKIYNEQSDINRINIRNYLLEKYKEKKILFLEFGVWEGNFTNLVSKVNKNAKSRIVGFDSFEGLPENWHKHPIGTFSTDGVEPEINDKRIQYIKGWFQNTIKNNLREILKDEYEEIIISFDADLYSSSLYCLCQLDEFKKDYIAIFDEFAPDECRALYDYKLAFGAKVEFIARADYDGFPSQVICKVNTCQNGDFSP